MSKVELKRSILKFAEDGLIKYLDMTSEQAKEKVANSTISIAFDRAPDVVAHYSQEQLVSEVLGI